MPRLRQPRPEPERLAALYRELGNVRAVGEALGVSQTSAAKWLREAGIETRRTGRPRKGADVGRINLHVSAVDHAGLRFRAAQRGAGLQATAAAIVIEALAECREPRELTGPPSKVITVALAVEVLDRLRVEADRRGVSVMALAAGLAVSAVPE